MSDDAQTGVGTYVSYGDWERDPDVLPILAQSPGYEPHLHYAQRRRVYEYWHLEGGQRVGRWTWERRA